MAIYIERWEVMDNPRCNRISFAYSDEQREQGLIGFMRHEFFEENGVGALVRLLRVDRIDELQTDYVLSKDSDAYKFNKRMEVEEGWLKEQSGKE